MSVGNNVVNVVRAEERATRKVIYDMLFKKLKAQVHVYLDSWDFKGGKSWEKYNTPDCNLRDIAIGENLKFIDPETYWDEPLAEDDAVEDDATEDDAVEDDASEIFFI
ncbi:hypothetical protein T484DRAFT_1758186 [Baffinella frigidus]|nr:hypothetical protein T484DRAFT_1758186 [Cryptophyta sp. CCMP2293]